MSNSWLKLTEKQMVDDVNKQIMEIIGGEEEKPKQSSSLMDKLTQGKPALDKLRSTVGGSDGKVAVTSKDNGRPSNGSGRGRGGEVAEGKTPNR